MRCLLQQGGKQRFGLAHKGGKCIGDEGEGLCLKARSQNVVPNRQFLTSFFFIYFFKKKKHYKNKSTKPCQALGCRLQATRCVRPPRLRRPRCPGADPELSHGQCCKRAPSSSVQRVALPVGYHEGTHVVRPGRARWFAFARQRGLRRDCWFQGKACIFARTQASIERVGGSK